MTGDYFDLLDWLVKKNKNVFVDLKLFDVPATVSKAVKRLSKRGAYFTTIHGNQSMMEAAAAEKGETINLEDLDRVELVDNLPETIPADITPSSETVTVEIINEGYFAPDVVVIKVGTTVIWENTQSIPYGTVTDPEQEEIFNTMLSEY